MHTDTTPDGRERRCVKTPHGEERKHLMGTIVTLLDRVGLDTEAEEAN